MVNVLRAVVCCALISTMSVFATPSTQIWIPSTDIQKYLNPHVGWDVYANAYGNGVISNGGVTVGVLPFSKIGMELGIDYRDLSGNHWDPLYFNAKIGTPEDAFFKYMPALAVGGYDFGTREDFSTYNIIYGLAAKTLGKAGRFSVGGFKGAVGAEAETFFTSSEGDVEDVGLLASWDRYMTEISDKLWVAVDYQSGKSGYGALSFGASWNFAPNVSMILGYDIYNDSDLYKPTVTIQFDANLF